MWKYRKKQIFKYLSEACTFAVLCSLLLALASFAVKSLTESIDKPAEAEKQYNSKEYEKISFSSFDFSVDDYSTNENGSIEVLAKNLSRYGKSDKPTIHIMNQTQYTIDKDKLLKEKIPIKSVFSEQPTVLIYHTHGTESYAKGNTYEEGESFRSDSAEESVVAVGSELEKALNELGIGVIHDTRMFDKDDFQSSYAKSRKAVTEWLEKAPSICCIIDIHRDSVESDGKQVKTYTEINGIPTAQVMLVVGTDEKNSEHKEWRSNLTLALHLQNTMNELYSTLARPIYLRNGDYNQDISVGCMLMEIGSSGNKLEEAFAAVRFVAQALSETLKSNAE